MNAKQLPTRSRNVRITLQSVGAALALLLAQSNIGEAAIFRVKADGNDANDGSTWTLAKRTVRNALSSSVAGDQVWVARGTYVERLFLKDGVSLYGGFVGDETVLERRNWKTNLSVLTLNLTNGPVVTITNAGPTTRLDGMVITGGTTIFGGGVSLIGSGPVIANNNIRFNSASGLGGGICIWGFKVVSLISNIMQFPIITNNVIINNSGYSTDANGGGIAVVGSSPLIAGNLMARNSAGQHGGGIVVFCRKIDDPEADLLLHSRPFIANNFIVANISAHTEGTFGIGGGIYASDSDYDGQPIPGAICAPTIINNVVSANGAMYGAGIALCDVITNPEAGIVQNNSIVGNNGAGLFWSNTSPTNLNNLIAYNAGGLVQGDLNATFANNDVYGNSVHGENLDYVGLPNATGINGNISVEPKLANYQIGDLHLQPDSPCVNAGLSSVMVPGWPDIDGQNRIQGAAVDIGADESAGTVWNVATPIILVSTNGNDTADGLTWGTAKKTAQAAIDAISASLVTGGEVWIAEGTYTGHIALPPFVYLYGGFAGNETNRAARNPALHPTILDGGGVAPVVVCENGGYLMSAVDGFTIRNGGVYTGGSLSPYPKGADGRGGGIACNVSSPLIANNIICSNSLGNPSGFESRGAGIFCYVAHARISSNVITRNEILTTFSSEGGGIACQFSWPTIEGNLIAENRAGSGAAIHAMFYARPYIVGNTIRNNAMYTNAPIYFGSHLGAVALQSCEYVVVDGNTIQNNVADAGAGLYAFAITGGGRIQNNLVLTNIGSSIMPVGGGFYCTVLDSATAPLFIVNNTFAGNRASGQFTEYGGALLIANSKTNALVLANNILAFNSSGICLDSGLTNQVLRNNCLYTNGSYNYGAVSGTLAPGVTDLHVDPLFVNPVAGNFHLRSTSPCIDAGTPTNAPAVDRDGALRPLDGNGDGVAAYDIGAYESATPPPVVWQNVFTHDFETDFPGTNWARHGSPTWDDTTYAFHSASRSAWCAASTLSPTEGYTNNMNAWMIRGPFSLADATDASLSFWYKNYSEEDFDFFCWLASTNGVDFSGYKVSGDQNSWRSQDMSFSSVPNLGNLCGQSQVWIAFFFQSDSSASGPIYTGAFVDDVVVQKAMLLPAQPRIIFNDGSFGYRSNCFSFNFTGTSGQVVVVECSSNLMNWTPLATNTLGTGPGFFFDTNSTNRSSLFYRLFAPGELRRELLPRTRRNP